MAFAQGDMFNRDDYPDPEQVRAKFGINLYVSEVPSHDFRCQISNDIASDLKNQYEKQAGEIVQNVLSEQITRITEVMESISHCCGIQEFTDTKTGETKTKKRKIYDTTIEKAKDLCKTFQGFRPINNEQSNKLLEVVKRLSSALNGVDSETLRDSDTVRDKVKNDVDDILSKFKF
jgi:predicted house-cleaning noncanonical NTP pyrophosphatase (MazG superfamily)